MSKEEKAMTNKEKALRLMDSGFAFLDHVACRGSDLDNMARGRELLRRAWNLLNTPDEEKTEVKDNGC